MDTPEVGGGECGGCVCRPQRTWGGREVAGRGWVMVENGPSNTIGEVTQMNFCSCFVEITLYKMYLNEWVNFTW